MIREKAEALQKRIYVLEKAQKPCEGDVKLYQEIPLLTQFDAFLKKYSRIGAQQAKATDTNFDGLNQIASYIDNFKDATEAAQEEENKKHAHDRVELTKIIKRIKKTQTTLYNNIKIEEKNLEVGMKEDVIEFAEEQDSQLGNMTASGDAEIEQVENTVGDIATRTSELAEQVDNMGKEFKSKNEQIIKNITSSEKAKSSSPETNKANKEAQLKQLRSKFGDMAEEVTQCYVSRNIDLGVKCSDSLLALRQELENIRDDSLPPIGLTEEGRPFQMLKLCNSTIESEYAHLKNYTASTVQNLEDMVNSLESTLAGSDSEVRRAVLERSNEVLTTCSKEIAQVRRRVDQGLYKIEDYLSEAENRKRTLVKYGDITDLVSKEIQRYEKLKFQVEEAKVFIQTKLNEIANKVVESADRLREVVAESGFDDIEVIEEPLEGFASDEDDISNVD